MIETRDIYFTAFLIKEGFVLSGFRKENRIVFFQFNIDQDLFNRMNVDFFNSEYNKMKSKINELKNLGM